MLAKFRYFAKVGLKFDANKTEGEGIVKTLGFQYSSASCSNLYFYYNRLCEKHVINIQQRLGGVFPLKNVVILLLNDPYVYFFVFFVCITCPQTEETRRPVKTVDLRVPDMFARVTQTPKEIL